MLSLRRARRALSRLATKGATTAIFLVLLILGAGALAWWHLDANAEDQARATEARGAAMVAQSAARAIEEIDQTLQTVIGGRRAPQSADLTQQERYTLLAERAPHDRYIGFIDVIAADGGILASTRPGQELKNWADRDYFWISRNEPLSGPYIGRPFAVTREDTAAIPISHRIDREGQFAGVAVAALRLSYFHDLLGELQSGPGASVTLLSEDGTILMRLPFDLNDIGRKTQAEAAVHDFIQSKAAAATLRLPGERGSQDVAFHRVGNLPLLVRVSVAPDKSGMFWLICVGAAVALAAGVLARRVRQDETFFESSATKGALVQTTAPRVICRTEQP